MSYHKTKYPFEEQQSLITNLLSVLPDIGSNLVKWLLGGFSVDKATLPLFFTFYFILPFIIAALAVLHLLFLHETVSNSPKWISSWMNNITFHPYYTIKDILGALFLFLILILLILVSPDLLGYPESYTPPNLLSALPHIKQEWYFLLLYAILWSIYNK